MSFSTLKKDLCGMFMRKSNIVARIFYPFLPGSQQFIDHSDKDSACQLDFAINITWAKSAHFSFARLHCLLVRSQHTRPFVCICVLLGNITFFAAIAVATMVDKR